MRAMSTVTQLAQHEQSFAQVVAANIRAEAARRGYNQLALAGELGVSRTWVNSRWYGRRPWQLEDVERVADLFDLPPAQLCANRDSNPEPADYEPGAVIVGPWPGAA